MPSTHSTKAPASEQPLGFLRRFLETCALCLVIASAQAMAMPDRPFDATLVYSLSIGLCCWLTMELGRFYFFYNPETGWPRGLARPLLVALAIVVGFVSGFSLAATLLGHPQLWHKNLAGVKSAVVITVLASVAASAYFFLRSRAAHQAMAREQAERQAAQAQLQRISAQLQPHMLFNTLANLRALISIDPGRAIEMLDRLNGLLRRTLNASRASSHSLADEFEALEDYLALMKIRLGERLLVHMDLPTPLKGLPIIPLLLQPLVENAILHGIEPSIPGGELWVKATLDKNTILLEVINSGAPLAQAAGRHSPGQAGVGQSLVRERLLQRYDGQANFNLETRHTSDQTLTAARVAYPHPHPHPQV